MQIDLSIKIAGITFPNPVLLASGPLGRTARAMSVVARAGAGGIVTKTITLEPRQGFPHPRLFSLAPLMLINSSGGPNPGLNAFREVIRAAKKDVEVPLVASPLACSLDEVVTIAEGLEEAGADMLEINFKFLTEMNNPESFLSMAIQEVKGAVRVPVGAKLSPHRPMEIPHLALLAQEAGADFLTLVNTVPAMSIDIETFRPRLGNPDGAFYSGPAIKPLAIKCIAETARIVSIPIFGVGGCASAEDAIEMMLAGARAVQVCTAAMFRGPVVFGEILDGITDYLCRKGIASTSDLCGKALFYLSGQSFQQELRIS